MRRSNDTTAGRGLAGIVASLAVLAEAAEPGYPNRSIRWVVAFAPGGSLDRVCRLIAPRLGDALGQQIVIDNRPGAGGNLSAELVAKAPADGYTIYASSLALVVNVSLYRKLAYDPLKDFTPVTLLGSAPNILVSHPSLPVRTVRELVAMAKRLPGEINYVSSGNGTSGHLAMELFLNMAGVRMVHIPYKSIAQAQADLLAGQVPLFFPTIPGALPFIRSGRVIALGVSGDKRNSTVLDVPTMSEAGIKGYEASAWYPIVAPAGLSRAIVDRLQAEIVATLRQPDTARQLAADGVDAIGPSPEFLASYMGSELVKWAKVVKAAGIQAQ
jgi:tripartite-type tricarboxylate transporter receptor subunit TctC